MGDVDEPDRVFVRLPVSPGAWAEALPPVPSARRVTVTLSGGEELVEHADALELLGYELVDDVAWTRTGPVEPSAWVLVDSELALAHPRWWRCLRAEATQVVALAYGPARLWLGPLLERHLDALTTSRTGATVADMRARSPRSAR